MALEQNDYPMPQTAQPGPPPLPKNPQLPAHPLGSQTDSTFEAEDAMLRAQAARRYNDVLRLLGYMDPETGQFIQGDVEQQANRQRFELGRSRELAVEDVTNQAQREGTLFSGKRATRQARAEHPFVSALADLDIQVPRSLADLYEQANDTVSDYTTQRSLLLAQAAARAAQRARENPSGGATSGTATGGGGGGSEDPPNVPPLSPLAGLPLNERQGLGEIFGNNGQLRTDLPPAPAIPVSPYAAEPAPALLPGPPSTTILSPEDALRRRRAGAGGGWMEAM